MVPPKGQDARGHGYVFGGRGGLYFRERLGRAGKSNAAGCLVAIVVVLLLILVAVVLR